MVCCDHCHHLFIFSEINSSVTKQLYTNYYPRKTFKIKDYRIKSFHGGLRSWLDGDDSAASRWVPPDVKVLDIGCGFGETLAYHQSRGCDAYGVEMDENVRMIMEKFHFKVKIGPFNPNLYPPESFDYVTMQQVIEHVEDPLETLKGVAQVLRRGGYVVLSTPNAKGWGARFFGRRWINWHVPYHRHFFSLSSIRIVAQEAGLQIVRYRTVTSSEWLRFQWAHLLAMPEEGEPSGFWSPLGKRSLRTKIGQKGFDLLHYARINHLLTRLFDSLGAGDNYLFLLKKP
jgi:2-polyprenyl-3-methyl-5-hydroxy-6-metoxy-1,4-benzoquinol methylase